MAFTSLKLDTEIKARINGSRVCRRSSHRLVREAIEQDVEREEQREQLRQTALAAWNEYRVTGQHVTAAEAHAWMALLEAGKHRDPPGLHD